MLFVSYCIPIYGLYTCNIAHTTTIVFELTGLLALFFSVISITEKIDRVECDDLKATMEQILTLEFVRLITVSMTSN